MNFYLILFFKLILGLQLVQNGQYNPMLWDMQENYLIVKV